MQNEQIGGDNIVCFTSYKNNFVRKQTGKEKNMRFSKSCIENYYNSRKLYCKQLINLENKRFFELKSEMTNGKVKSQGRTGVLRINKLFLLGG